MNSILHWFAVHQTTTAVISLWLFSNIVTAMPSPTNNSGEFYKFFFALVHGLAGSIPRVFPGMRVFGDPTQGSKTYFNNDNNAGDKP